MIHAALHERAVFVHFAIDLAIGVIQARLQVGRGIGIEHRRARLGILYNRPASRVACGACIQFRRGERLCTSGDAGLAVHLPVTLIGCLRPVRQARAMYLTDQVRSICCARMRPVDMLGTWAIDGLARHIRIGPCGCRCRLSGRNSSSGR